MYGILSIQIKILHKDHNVHLINLNYTIHYLAIGGNCCTKFNNKIAIIQIPNLDH